MGYLCCIIVLLTGILSSNPQQLTLSQLTNENGLSHNTVYAICQDHLGFMWFGTANGLNRYDGYDFKKYYYNPADTNSLSNSYVWSVFEDSEKNLWIGTIDGLNRFDRANNHFVHHKHHPNHSGSLSSSYVRVVFEDRGGTLWIGTKNGLNRWDKTQNRFHHYLVNPENPDMLDRSTIISLYEDRFERLWVCTGRGVFVYNPAKDHLETPPFEAKFPAMLNTTAIGDICEDNTGNLWILSWNNGIAKFHISEDSLRLIEYMPPAFNNETQKEVRGGYAIYEDQANQLWLGSRKGLFWYNHNARYFTNTGRGKNTVTQIVRAIQQDAEGNIWLGTDGSGIQKMPKNTKSFQNHQVYSKQSKVIWHSDIISAVAEDSTGQVWIGTWSGGLYRFNRELHQEKWYRVNPRWGEVSGSPDFIQKLYVDKQGVLWVGTPFSGGLYRYDENKDIFIEYRHQAENPFSLGSDHVTTIYEDSSGRLWIGTDPAGLSRFDREQEKFVHFRHRPGEKDSLSSNKVRAIYEDEGGRFWVATWGGGLNLFDREEKRFIHFRHQSGNANSLSDDRVETIYEYPPGILWIGTNSGGLNRFDVAKNEFRHYMVKDGLPSNGIRGIADGGKGKLWITTDNGLSCMDVAAEKFRNYDVSDGLPSNEFLENAIVQRENGAFLLGTKKGFVQFDPSQLKDNAYLPKVALTDFEVNNRPVKLDTVISGKQSIQLRYDENIISFRFAALSFAAPEKNRYRYRLSGMDNDWVNAGERRFANYTNLSPGDYTFIVQGSNNDGLWSPAERSIRISISPPWWQTGWAYSVYFLLVIFLAFRWQQFTKNRTRIRNELKMQRFEAEKLREIDSMKSRFFANISHEFRTPLTLILGPVQQLFASIDDAPARENLSLIEGNARRLLQLINQLLDLSKLEDGRMQLRVEPVEMTPFLRRIVRAFSSFAEQKGIELHFSPPENDIRLFIDPKQMETVFTNLLSNAFKFTSQEGRVILDFGLGIADLKAGEKSDIVEIKVKDTGIGIPAERLPHIFDRFYQAHEDRGDGFGGSGIGLALCRELVRRHGGQIDVKSKAGKGSTFIVRLPPGKAHFESSDIAGEGLLLYGIGEAASVEKIPAAENAITSVERTTTGKLSAAKTELPLLLIVEDTAELREYIARQFAADYRIFPAKDGAEGWQAALKNPPDLIISDVMMPNMNGFELCAKLKKDARTSHIPVILLTARAAHESKMTGWQTGADDYITKPFDAEELVARAKNLVAQRRRLQERFRREVVVQPSEITVNSVDEDFLKRAMAIVEQYIADTTFSAEIFADAMHVSRRTLTRKLKAITGQPIREFIQTIRLKRAAQLIAQKSGNMTEIAYDTGFSNPSHFAEAFRKQFGQSPSAYAAGQALSLKEKT